MLPVVKYEKKIAVAAFTLAFLVFFFPWMKILEKSRALILADFRSKHGKSFEINVR